jgi:3-methylcrotonyl-CoA carboxylase alpha subunit
LGEDGRIETGVEEGDEISPFYDPMIAKVIAWGEQRQDAIDELAAILAEAEVWPVRTNAAFLVNALDHPAFAAADIDTSFIADHLGELVPDAEPEEQMWQAAALVAVLAAEEATPLPGLAGLRLNAPPRFAVALEHAGQTRSIVLEEAEELPDVAGFADGGQVVVFADGQAFGFTSAARGIVGHGAHDGEILAPMPGKVTSVEVVQGEKVVKGQRLLTIEAMKMEHGLAAPFDGMVAELAVTAGAQVQVDALLAKIEPSIEPSAD